MTFQGGANLYTANTGTRPENVEIPFVTTRAPTIYDTFGGTVPVGKRWVNTVAGTEYSVTSLSSSSSGTTANWTLLGTNGGALNTLSDDANVTVTPVANNIQIAGTANQVATTAGTGSVAISLIGPYTPATYTAHGVLLGEGTSSIVATTAGTNGQVLIGSTGADPAFSTLTSSDGSITFTTGAHTLSLQVTSGTGVVKTLTGNSGGALSPTAGNISTLGTGSITIVGSGSTLTTELTGLTNHAVQVGAGTATLTQLTVGTNGQVLLGSTAADPAFGTLTTSTGVLFTTGAASLAVDVQHGGYAVNAASTGVALVAQHAYTVTQAAQTSFSLPATAAVGDTFLVASGTGNTSGWIITQGAGQEIWANTNHTTNGATGTLAGAIHCSVVLMCVVANVDFIIVGGSGLTGLTFT